MSVRIGTFRSTSLAFLVLSVLVALCLAIVPARAQDLVAQTGDLFVANKPSTRFGSSLRPDMIWVTSPPPG